jgi:hypothetical protein
MVSTISAVPSGRATETPRMRGFRLWWPAAFLSAGPREVAGAGAEATDQAAASACCVAVERVRTAVRRGRIATTAMAKVTGIHMAT